jgi:DtxR family Mn-dependent transcriptional regulator
MDRKTAGAYLKAIYVLEEDGKEASTVMLANSMGVRPASVTEIAQKLASEKLVDYSPYHGVRLTKKGKEAAEKIVRKHRLIETFLKNTLSVKNDISGQASGMEHSLSDHADEQLCIFLGRPMHSVDNKEIPHCTKKITCETCLRENHQKK